MKKNDKELMDALAIFGKSYVAELGNQLRKLDKKASGDLLKSLDSRVIKTGFGTVYTIELKAEKYLKYVDGGRRPKKGYPPPIKKISDWARMKGISQDLVFPIRYNIWRYGIEPTHVIKKTLKKMQSVSEMSKFEEGVGDWVDDMVGDMLLDISKNNNITVRNK